MVKSMDGDVINGLQIINLQLISNLMVCLKTIKSMEEVK